MSDSLLSIRPEFGTWKRGALHIEYRLGVLEEIRRTVQEGFHKIPHGGVETGGLLYGKWDGAMLTISAWRPMQCEHPLGPRFQLSGPDEIALAAQLATGEPELDQFQVVGWFSSHSRGALLLRGPDVDLHAKYFPEPWQPILLLCASRNQPTQAAFYSRADSTLAVGTEVEGFEVVPNPGAVPRPARRAPGAGQQARPEPNESMRIFAARVGSEPVETVGIKMGPELAAGHGSGVWAPIDPGTASAWLTRGYERVEEPGAEPIVSAVPPAAGDDAEGAEGVNAAEAAEAAPKFTAVSMVPRRLPWRMMTIAWAGLWLALAVTGVWAILRLAAPAPVLEIRVAEVTGVPPGQLAIRWNLKGAVNETLRGGELAVTEGGTSRESRVYTLSADELRAGTLTYWRRGGLVDVRLSIETGAGQQVVGTARFGSATGTAADEAAQTDPALSALREQLLEQRRRGRDLERQVLLEERRSSGR